MRRGWLWGGAAAALLGVLFVVSAFMYASSLSQQSASLPPPPPRGLTVSLMPESIDPSRNVLGAVATLALDDALVDHGTHLMRKDLTVRVEPALTGGVFVLRAGEPEPGPQRIEIPVSGLVQRYPFDSYAAAVTVVGAADDLGLIDGGFVLDQRLPGWSAQVTSVATDQGGLLEQQIALSRAGSTITVSLLILSLMIVVAVVAVCAVVLVRRRRDEVRLMLASWFAALIFAVIPLRNFLPGAPPIGSWIDILVFFWVEVVLVLVLSVYVVVWIVTRREDAA